VVVVEALLGPAEGVGSDAGSPYARLSPARRHRSADQSPVVSATMKRLKGRYGVEHELGIEGGTVVTGRGRARANVYIDGGRIAAVTGSRAPSLKTIDAPGLLVMPGGVDAHVHFMDPGQPEREDFTSGSAAAALAGVTTVLEHTHCSP